MENWKPIPGTNGCIEVSDKGRIRSLLRGEPHILKTQADRKGYHRVRVTIDRNKMSFKIHREVAKAFVPNFKDLPQVNHKDGNKANNAAEDLEWVTNQENAHHAIRSGLWASVREGARKECERRMKPILGQCIADGIVETKHFRSVSEAEQYIGSRHVSDVLKGKRSMAKGWTFRYEEVKPNADTDRNCSLRLIRNTSPLAALSPRWWKILECPRESGTAVPPISRHQGDDHP